MRSPRGSLPGLLILTLLSLEASAIQVVVPSAPQGGIVIQPNFLGISFELSFLDKYCELRLGLHFAFPTDKSKLEAMSTLRRHHS